MVVALLSHGDQRGIYGTDGNIVSTDRLIRYLMPHPLPGPKHCLWFTGILMHFPVHLSLGSPKYSWFRYDDAELNMGCDKKVPLQACRGNEIDPGYTMVETHAREGKESSGTGPCVIQDPVTELIAGSEIPEMRKQVSTIVRYL